MRAKGLLIVGLVIALLTVPATTVAQGSEGTQESDEAITFYGHVFGSSLDQPMPANTEAPIGESNYGIGSGDHCIEGASQTPLTMIDVESCEEQEGGKLVLFSTAGPVDVDSRAEFQREGAYAQLHNERGQTKPIQLDTNGQVTASVFGTWDSHGWFVGAGDTNCLYPHPPNIPCLYPYWGWDPGVYEDVVMEATLYHADLGDRTNSSQAPPIQEALENEEATLIAEGQWGPGQVMNGLPGAPNAFQFPIQLGSPQVDTIPRSDDFFLVYETYQNAGDVKQCMRCPIRWYSGEFFPPTYDLPVDNPFTVERTIPNFANGKLAVLGIINTPWGSYDVDSESVELDIEGPNGDVQPDAINRFSDFSVAHGGHFEPVNVTWIWDYRKDQVSPGDYQVTVSAQNLQNTARASCTASFTIDETDQGGPAPGESTPAECGIQGVLTEEKAEQAQRDANETTAE